MAVEEGMVESAVARALDVSGARVRQLMVDGRLGFVQTQLGRVYDPSDVERLRAERERRRQNESRHPAGTRVAARELEGPRGHATNQSPA